MKDHPEERPPGGETTRRRDHPDERPREEITQRRDHSNEGPPWGETAFLIRLLYWKPFPLCFDVNEPVGRACSSFDGFLGWP